MLRRLTAMVYILAFSASIAFASGFSIYEQGAKASAMGGAFIAQANDVSSVFFNPAGITGIEGFKMGLGTTIIMPSFSFQGPNNIDPNLYTEAEKAIFPPSTFYTTYQINEKLSAGFGFFTLFGLGSEWDQEWPGRFLATKSEVQTFFLNPVVAYEVMDGLSLAVGANVVIGTVQLGKSVPFGAQRNIIGESNLEASTTAFGFNGGLQYKVTDELTLGAVYRHNILLEFTDGDATFDFPDANDAATNAEIASFFPNTKGSADLELPNLIGLGIAYQFSEKLVAEFDYMQLGWSSYDQLIVKFDDPVGGELESIAEREYEDSFSLRFGLEYMLQQDIALRFGYIRDNHAAPDSRLEPSLPEGDRNLYCAGIGYTMGDIQIDAFYMLLNQEDREITNSAENFNGTYKGVGNLFGASVGFSL